MLINVLLGASASVFGVLSIKSYLSLDKDFNQQYKSKLFKLMAERKINNLLEDYDDRASDRMNDRNVIPKIETIAHSLESLCEKILDGEKLGYDMDIVPTTLANSYIKAAKVVKKELGKELPSLLGKFIHK